MKNTTSKTQTQPEPFSAEQRKGMAHLLADTKKRVEESLESDYALNSRIKEEILPKLAEKRGAGPLLEKIRRLRKESKETEAALGKLGFTCSHSADNLSLADDAPEELERALEEAERSARNERQARLLKFDKAILTVWAAKDADEAKRVVGELL
jgi:hypothetical protein